MRVLTPFVELGGLFARVSLPWARDDLRADVFDYIERFYIPRRRHFTIGCISPVQFENLKCA